MFVDWKEAPPPPPWQPKPRKRAGRDEKILLWLIGGNLFLLLVAPFAGSSVLHAIAALLR